MNLARFIFSAALHTLAASGITIPSTNKANIYAYEEYSTKENGAIKFAEAYTGPFSPERGEEWDPDTNTWTFVVNAPGALNLNFGFTTYKLPDNASLTIKDNYDNSKVRTITVT